MSQVFVVCWDPKRNTDDAKRFGSIINILPPKKSIFADNWEQMVPEMVDTVRGTLLSNSYDPQGDYILLMGDPIAIAISACIACEIGGGTYNRFNCLKWDREEEKYYCVEIEI